MATAGIRRFAPTGDVLRMLGCDEADKNFLSLRQPCLVHQEDSFLKRARRTQKQGLVL